MNFNRFLTILYVVLFISGCSILRPSVDELDPMVPATEEPANGDELLDADLPDPLSQSGDIIADNSLWQIIRDGFSISQGVDNDAVTAQRNWYASHGDYMGRVALRAKRYLYHINTEAQKRNLPTELVLLPIVESAFDPFAYSRSHASGPWQFIPSTGKHFGLEQSWWYDARRDVLASTDAALTYLQQLVNRFDGDWLLALASYNAGAGTVSRAIRRNAQAGLPTDFWHLSLPRETRSYVPKLIAVSQIIADPQKYNLELPAIPNEPYFDVVKTDGQLDLSLAADMAAISPEELSLLNPGFNRWATPPHGPHRLLIPVDRTEDFKQSLANVPADSRVVWERYTIKKGDNLLAISHRFGVPVQTIRQANQLSGNQIIAGRTLLVPQNAKGDYATALNKVLARNKQPVSRQQTTYKVKSGDSLWSISRRFNTSMADIAAANQMSTSSVLRPGQTLKIWQAPSSSSSQTAAAKKIDYAVRNGDSLYAIAQRFKVSITSIESWNNLSRQRYLQPGQRLTLYIDPRNQY